jgi:anaerobic selenocysteine-containing dehydrogenase
VEINPLDAERLQLESNELVIISTSQGKLNAKVAITEHILPGVIFVPFHFLGVNSLTTGVLDTAARTPEFKAIGCTIERASNRDG